MSKNSDKKLGKYLRKFQPNFFYRKGKYLRKFLPM